MGLGHGKKKLAKILACHSLIAFAIDKGCDHLQVYNGSLLVINWVNNIQQCCNIHIVHILEELQSIKLSILHVTCTHIHRDMNKAIDRLSKEGLKIVWGLCHIEERLNGHHYSYYHRPFLDDQFM